MKKIIPGLLFLLSLTAAAQEKGVNFQHGLSWEQVQSKAKADNKYIFMDCFTTWCGPCKYMSKQIFTQEAVGDFMNANFVSVGVQIDSTNNDNDEVKNWYTARHDIEAKYKIMAYPTFLIFDPNGQLVHRIVGSSQTSDEFIAKAKEGLDPSKQYYSLLAKYKAGDKDTGFLYNLASAALLVYDDSMGAHVFNEYLATQTNIYTPRTLTMLQGFTQRSNDEGFSIMLQHPDKVDAVLGKGVAEFQVISIIFGEEAWPLFIDKSAKQFALITGEPDWNKLRESMKAKCPSMADEAFAFSKAFFYYKKGQWNDLVPAVNAFLKSYGDDISDDYLNQFASQLFVNCGDENCLKNALEWTKRLLVKSQNPDYINTYALILHRLGRKDEAIQWEQKALSHATDDELKQYCRQALAKMKAGEKTWK